MPVSATIGSRDYLRVCTVSEILYDFLDFILLIQIYSEGFKVDGTGYIALDSTNHLTILAYRGTHSTWDWLYDLAFLQKPVVGLGCFACFAHAGFYDMWLQNSEGIFNAIEPAIAQHPQNRIIVTGHSMGGALATLAAAFLRYKGYDLDLYTFGQVYASLQHITKLTEMNEKVTARRQFQSSLVHLSSRPR